MGYKRKSFILKLIVTICAFVYLINVVGCKKAVPDLADIKVYSDFSVNFLDVGQGDCIFIRLPDGKNMLIDCGLNDENKENSNYIKNYLNQYDVKVIDYFVLTHPDVDHIGNALDLINAFTIGKMFIPQIHQSMMQFFQSFYEVLQAINQKQIEYQVSMFPTQIVGENYHLAFLSPQNDQRSSYDKILQNLVPTDEDINNLSPIIYFSCFDKRFIFTGDAQIQEENYVVDNFDSGIYDLYYRDFTVDLNEVDYLKLSHHGSNDGSGQRFLSLLKPKNVIISVGNDNYYGHPASETLLRLQEICINYNVYRTDQQGTICVYKSNNQFITQATKTN